MRHKWINALHRENISLKHVFLCIKHFREEDVEHVYKVQNPDGSVSEIPRGQPKLRKDAVPCFLQDCPSYYSAPSSSRGHRFSFESKQDDQFALALQLSRVSKMAEEARYHVETLEELKEMLASQTLRPNWLFWLSADGEVHFISLSKSHQNISVRSFLTVSSTLGVKAFHEEENINLSVTKINDIRQIGILLMEIENVSTIPSSYTNSVYNHIANARHQISKAMIKLEEFTSSPLDSLDDSPILARLQFITCQLENSILPKNRRRYNIITQVLALKSHLISSSCYNHLQSLDCLSLPHYHTLENLYSSFGLDCEYTAYLNQATVNFSSQEKNVIVQMDEIHVTSDVSYQGGEIVIGSCLNPDDPIKTVFAIMVSSLHKKWSTIVRLVPLSTTSAKDIYPIIVQVIDDVEKCGLSVQVLCTDNYPLNVSIFKLFSPNQKTLQTIVPHPTSENRPLILMFDFVHILKTIRNNWLNLKNENKVFIYPSIEDFYPTYTNFPLTIQNASFNDIRLIYYKLEQNNIAKTAPTSNN